MAGLYYDEFTVGQTFELPLELIDSVDDAFLQDERAYVAGLRAFLAGLSAPESGS